MRTGSSGRRAIALLALALVVPSLVAAGFVAGQQWGRPDTPSSSSVEAGFARDMQVHHAQAVEMSLIVRDRSDGTEVRGLAYDIATSQQQQAGQMAAWLQLWGLPAVGGEEQMAWMSGRGHSGMDKADGRMPGMASPAELQRLRDARGVAAEVLYLRLMIRHHKAGAAMADAARERTSVPVVASLTSAIVSSQRNEVEVMQDLVAERGASTEREG